MSFNVLFWVWQNKVLKTVRSSPVPLVLHCSKGNTVLRWFLAKHHRAEEIPSWYGPCRIHYPCSLPTEADSALNYSGFMVILPEESNLKQVQHHQEMRPVTWSFKRIWASKYKCNLAENTPHSSGYSSLYCWLLGTVFPLVVSTPPTFDKKFPDFWWNWWI